MVMKVLGKFAGKAPAIKGKHLTEKKLVAIDFLYLDLNTCTRCLGTDKSLDEALEDVSKVLETCNYNVVVKKINVSTKELAIRHKFVSSPTIRVNGRDIQMEFRESLCESCGDVCGSDVDCRVWVYHGREYTEPPKALIIEGILREVFGQRRETEDLKPYVLPENLRRFYESLEQKKSSCCSGSGENCC